MDTNVFLIDTNIFLEILLDQEHAEDCLKLFEWLQREKTTVLLTIFTLYSIGIILTRDRKFESWDSFLRICDHNGFIVIPTNFQDELDIQKACIKFGIDLDDAHQYWTAKSWDARLVSFDKDFDSTDLQREEPKSILTLC